MSTNYCEQAITSRILLSASMSGMAISRQLDGLALRCVSIGFGPEKAGLRRDAVRSQVIEALEALIADVDIPSGGLIRLDQRAMQRAKA